ncbi:DUF6458 family protein [Kribbella sp. NPDC055071]|jgi:hypothetical protein
MGIGAGIFLLALGGVLAFGVSDRISGVDLTVIGYILMGAGALGIVLTLFLSSRGRTRETVIREERLDAPVRDPRDPRL